MRFAEFRLCFRLNSRCSFEQPQFGLSRFDGQFRETRMKRLIVAALVSLTLVPVGALAQERGGDAALGALSGAVVFGPVGAVAGAWLDIRLARPLPVPGDGEDRAGATANHG